MVVKRWIPWITAGVVAFALVWAFIYLQATHPFGGLETKLRRDQLPGIAIQFVNVKFVGRQNGEKAWELKTDVVEVSRDRQYATFRGPIAGVLLKGEKPAVSISASQAVYNTITRNLSAPGSANLKVSDGPVLIVKNVYWNARKSKLVCSGGIRARFDDSTMEGKDMTADLAKKEVVLHNVRGVIRLSK